MLGAISVCEHQNKPGRRHIKTSVDIAAIGVAAGTLPLLLLPQLPPWPWLMIIAAIALLLWRQTQNSLCQAVCWLLCGFLLASGSARVLVGQITALIGAPQNIIATVSSIRLQDEAPGRVIFRIEQVDGRWLLPALYFSAGWQQEIPCAGQRWRLQVRLRPVHAILNQGGFDSQRWALAQRQPLTGRITQAALLDPSCNLRQRIIHHAEQNIPAVNYKSVLLALAFGERTSLEKALRTLMLKTGIAHLMAISGLHVAMAAILVWLLLRGVQFFFPPYWIGYRFPLVVSWFFTVIYVWLAGGQPPAVRTGVALTLWMLLRIGGVQCSSWQVWLWCVSLILLCDPLAVLSDSFWLSVMAVASLIFWFDWVPLCERVRTAWFLAPVRWLHLQLGITLLLVPMQAGLFQGMTLTSLPANLWAVPLVSFLTVPLILWAIVLGVFPTVSAALWWLADQTLLWVFIPLGYLQRGWVELGASSLLISLAGWLLVVCWRFNGWRYHTGGIAALAICGLLWRERPDPYRWRVDMLDVGHGLAVVVSSQGRAVMFDTGGRWPSGDAAERHILPFLTWRGLVVEQIIISHSHLDHIGGLATLQQAFPQASVRSPLLGAGHLPCMVGVRWQWQTLDFHVLGPSKLVPDAGNNDSCIVRVSDGQYSVLLTGDVERKGEAMLLQQQRYLLKATVLQVPHHGSKTSSSSPFIRAVSPKAALASASRYNRWHFPAEKIVTRYVGYQVDWRDTARSGQLSVFFFDKDWQIQGFREQLVPRWYHRWFGVKHDNE